MSDEVLRPEEEQEEKQPFSVDLFFWLQALVMALVSLILVFTFVGRIITVDGSSMFPTLHHGDLLLLQCAGYTPQQGDVVVLTKNSFRPNQPLVKRVIAVAGQTVDIDYETDTVTVDGVPLDEPYLNEQDMHLLNAESIRHVEIPEGYLFVMGDNRNDSTDSRDPRIDLVDTRCVLGGVRFILFPFHDIGPVESVSLPRS